MENTNLNNHIDLSFLEGSFNKIIYHNDLNNFLIVIDKDDKSQVVFLNDEIKSLRNYLNNLHNNKVQGKIKDNENNIIKYQQWVNEYKQQIISFDNEMAETQRQLDEAFTNKNIKLANQLNSSLSDLQTRKEDINNKINAYENNIITCQKENEKLQK